MNTPIDNDLVDRPLTGKMEHALSADTLDSITDFMDFIQDPNETVANRNFIYESGSDVKHCYG